MLQGVQLRGSSPLESKNTCAHGFKTVKGLEGFACSAQNSDIEVLRLGEFRVRLVYLGLAFGV